MRVTIKTGDHSTAQGELIMGATVTLYCWRAGDDWSCGTKRIDDDTHTLTVPASWIVPIEEGE